jgi:TonB family protein
MNALAFPWLLSYLFNALWQIPLVFAAAWVVSRMLRSASARAGHRVWVAALLLQIVLPACTFRIAALWHALLGLLPPRAAANHGDVRVLFGPTTASVTTLHIPLALEAAIVLAWACCLLYFAGRLVWGLHQTRNLARGATRISLTGETALRWSQHCHRLGIIAPPPQIAASPDEIGPVTVGLRSGLVLVPSAFLENIPAADLDAVLAHELAHIARRDFAKNFFYSLVSLPVAWHPVMWRTRARLAESRELVCDAIAADAIAAQAAAGRKQYAQSLLRIAAMLVGRPSVTLHALGIFNFNADARTLERRVMTLTHKPAPLSTPRRILIAAACSAVAFATCTSALALHADVSALTASAENQASGPAAPTKIHVKSSIMSGQKISGEIPKYPADARAKKIQGAVVLDVIIGKDGAVENIRVQKTPVESLAKSAVEAVRTWRYRPYLLNGDPIEVETTVNVVYSLGE